ncbi:MAG TPA: hypothetical protein IAD18_04160 [Candidatus Limisoma intestinavium]|uniref:Uncharacterized protein n=1 Tax=Candidatus Limisoma intestinavium TaxID=2840856 RepID=A0A9D1LGG7_9BACT|nr:hypothetical protein [Candidatus Limisoma intestinavium]
MAIKLDDYFDDDASGQQAPSGEQEPVAAEQPQPKRVVVREYDSDYIITNGQRRKKRFRKWLLWAAIAAVVLIAINMLFFSKKISGGQVRGYLIAIEKSEGIVFDSYECTLIVDYPDSIVDADRLVFRFSTTDQQVGKRLYNAMRGDSIVLVEYDRYTTNMPWRGESDNIVSDAMLVKATPVSRSVGKVRSERDL